MNRFVVLFKNLIAVMIIYFLNQLLVPSFLRVESRSFLLSSAVPAPVSSVSDNTRSSSCQLPDTLTLSVQKEFGRFFNNSGIFGFV